VRHEADRRPLQRRLVEQHACGAEQAALGREQAPHAVARRPGLRHAIGGQAAHRLGEVRIAGQRATLVARLEERPCRGERVLLADDEEAPDEGLRDQAAALGVRALVVRAGVDEDERAGRSRLRVEKRERRFLALLLAQVGAAARVLQAAQERVAQPREAREPVREPQRPRRRLAPGVGRDVQVDQRVGGDEPRRVPGRGRRRATASRSQDDGDDDQDEQERAAEGGTDPAVSDRGSDVH
jgi:hypothetical protein